MTAPMFPPEFKGKIEELLGERRPKGTLKQPPASAVRWRDLETLRKELTNAGGVPGPDTPGTPGDPPTDPDTPTEWDARLTQAENRIDAAEYDADQALITAQNTNAALGQVIEDTNIAVQAARDDFAIDFQTVVDAADRVDTAEIAAVNAATNALPASLTTATRHFTNEQAGAPDTIAGFSVGYPGVFDADGMTFPATVTTTELLRTKGVLPYVAGHVYRVTAYVMVPTGTPVTNRLRMAINRLTAAHTNMSSVAVGNLVPPAAGVWTEMMVEWTATAVTGAAWLRAGATLYGGTGPAHALTIAWLKVEDVSAEKAAAGFAASASAYADTATGAAALATTERGLAQTARGEALGYRDTALLAAGDAEDAATAARTSMMLAARYNGGASVLYDVLLDPANGWARGGTPPGTLAQPDNVFAPTGKTWDFTVTAAQNDGVAIDSTSEVNWPGQTNAGGYVVEVDYTLLSGVVTGAGVLVSWVNSASAFYNKVVPLSTMQAGIPFGNRRRIGRAVFKKPANFSGTFSRNIVQMWANNAGHTALGTPSAKRIQIHRIMVRAATDEELGGGEVLAGVMAQVSQDYFTSVQTDEAIAEAEERVDVLYGGARTFVLQNATALSDLNGSVAKASLLASTDDGTAIAGFEIASWNTQGQGTGAAVKLHGDVLAKGTMSAGAFVAGFGSNMLQNSRFYDGTLHWQALAGSEGTFARRNPGQSYAHASFASLSLYQDGTAAQVGEIRYAPQLNPLVIGERSPGVSCKPGTIYNASGYLSAHRCRVRTRLIFWDAAGAVTGPIYVSDWHGPALGSSTHPDSWARIWVSAVAPAAAVWVTASYQKEGTQAGSADSWLFLWKPQLEETHSVKALPSLYTSGEAGYWTGDSFFSRSIAARAIDVDDLVVTGLATMNRAYVRHINMNGFAIAKHRRTSKAKWGAGASATSVLKLTANYAENDWTNGWVTLITVFCGRLKGYSTQLDIMLDHAAAGSWDSSRPNMSVLQTRWQRKRSNQGDASFVTLNTMHSQSGEYGVRVTNALQFTDGGPSANDSGFYTIYRLQGRKANIERHQRMSPYVYNVRCTMTHYKQG